jgi:hypothetical protein
MSNFRNPFRFRARGRPRHTPGEMNKTEAAYADALTARKLAGEIHDFRFEAIKLRLAEKTFLTMDFLIVGNDGEIALEDVKGAGFYEDDARVKVKVAAQMYPWLTFRWIHMKKGAVVKVEEC